MTQDPSETPVITRELSISLSGPDDVVGGVIARILDRLQQEMDASPWSRCEYWCFKDAAPPAGLVRSVPTLPPLNTLIERPVVSPESHNIRVAVANPKIAEAFAEYGLWSLHQLQNFTEAELLALPGISSNRLNPVKGAMRTVDLALLEESLPLKDRRLDEMPLGVLPWLILDSQAVMGDLATSPISHRICRDFRTMDLVFFAGLDANRCRQQVVFKNRDGGLNQLLESYAQLASAVLMLRQAIEVS